MELNMTPETEAKLNKLAERTHRDKDELLEEAVKRLLVYYAPLEREFYPVEISGEPLSKTVLGERR
jgi:predicted transcriptional regulator